MARARVDNLNMEPGLFFLVGIPVALLLERAIASFTRKEAADLEAPASSEHGGRLEPLSLPWQTGSWPDRVRVVLSGAAPLFMAAAGWRFGLVQAAVVSLFLIAMLACTATDLIRFRVPNLVTYPGAAIAFAAALVLPGGDPVGALIAAAAGGGVFLVMAVVTRGGVGLGDVKLALLIGAALGLPGGYQAMFIGILAGGVTIGALFAAGVVSRRQAVPYAPFLAMTAALVILIEGAAFAPL